ncbi:aldolase [Tistrella mobilis]|uniref:class I fructose-bisphosphate aldolase n=1 Tax=Tistrella mobilis TaxID=171437 RepID=UPI0035579BAB
MSDKFRLNRLFRNGRCLDVAIDHGIFNEPTMLSGLEDAKAVFDKLIAAAPDAIQTNFGQADLLQSVPTPVKPALVMRVDAANVYNRHKHSHMWSTLQQADDPVLPAVQLDAACVVINLLMLPGEHDLFRQCVENIAKVRAACDRYRMPLMIEPLVMAPHSEAGGYMVDGDAEKIVALVRFARELGADVIKADPTTNPEDFHRVVETARCPVLVRGGGKEDLLTVLKKSEALLKQGAKGLVYGRNVYQHDNPTGVTRALMTLIHDDATAEEAFAAYKAVAA